MQTHANCRQIAQRIATAVLVGADAAALTGLRSSASAAVRQLPHLGTWLLRAGLDRVLERLAAGGMWLAAAWLAVGLVAALAAALPGTPGRVSAAICRMLLPRAARKLVAGAAGLGVLLAPAAALAASPGGSAVDAVAAVANGHSPGNRAGGPTGHPLPPPTWPTSRHPNAPRGGDRAARVRSHRGTPAAPPGATVRVRPGDCLWLLAARHLRPNASDAEVAAYWPSWYATNHRVIGTDPALVRPGELLRVPDPPHHRRNGSPR
jgi:resuscitation-promoting factor RpfA